MLNERNDPMKKLPFLLMLAFAAPAGAADLLEIYRLARDNDPAYASAKAAYQAGLEKLPQGLANLLPQVALSADATRKDVETNTTNYQGNSNGYTLSLTQPIYRAQNWAAYEQAKQQVTQAEAQYAQAEQDLVLRVAQAYFDVLLAENNVTLAAAQKTAISEQLEQAKRNFEVGTATITDTHEAQARYDLTVAQEIAARNELDVKQRALELIIGRLAPALAPFSGNPDFARPAPDSMEHWVTEAEQKNPTLKVQQAAKVIADEEVDRNRAGHHPTLDLVASYRDGRDVSSTGRTDSQTSSLGVQLNVPLYQGGATASKVREALANQEKARQDLENTRRQVGLQARQSYLSFTSGISQVKALEQALLSSQSQLDSTRLGQEVGVRTAVDVLNAQQQLYAAKRDLNQAIYNAAIAYLRLKGAAGVLNEEELALVNKRLAK
jgi:outer membrane protein